MTKSELLSHILLGGSRKPEENLKIGHSKDRYLNPGPSEYKEGLSLTLLERSVMISRRVGL